MIVCFLFDYNINPKKQIYKIEGLNNKVLGAKEVKLWQMILIQG